MKKLIRYCSYVLLLAGASIWICIGCFRPGTFFKTPNLGHRLGGDIIEEFPENTLDAFRIAMQQHESKEGYLYSECDLRETADHQIALFHDWDLARLVPDTQENRDALSVKQIDDSILFKDFTLQQLQQLKLQGGARIPTLDQFLACAAELHPEKLILLEIKLFHSDAARARVIQQAQAFRETTGAEIHFLAFIRNLKRSHPAPRQWLDEFQAAGFRVYQVYRPKTPENDLCETW